RDILGKGEDRHRGLGGKLADAAIEQSRLRGRAAGGVDRERDRLDAAQLERTLERARIAPQRQAAPAAQPDHAVEAQHGDDRLNAAPRHGRQSLEKARRHLGAQVESAAAAQDRLGRIGVLAIRLVQSEAGKQPQRRGAALARLDGMASANRTQAARSASPSIAASALPRSGDGEALPASRNGGLAITCANAPGSSRGGGRSRSPAIAVIRVPRSFKIMLTLASRTRSRWRSKATTRQVGTRAARQRLAAPTPQPTSSTISPALAGTAAASSTASIATRNPSRGWRRRTAPPRIASSLISGAGMAPFTAPPPPRGSPRGHAARRPREPSGGGGWRRCCPP